MPTLFAVYFLPVNYSGCRKDMLLIKSIKELRVYDFYQNESDEPN